MRPSPIKLITTVSRPRFWLYLAGPLLVGSAAADRHFYLDPTWYALFAFFLLPANFFLYGINDYHDYDTDQLNPKKQGMEHALSPEERVIVRPFLLAAAALNIVVALAFRDLALGLLLSSFLFLAYAYSAPPLRFKQHPFIDSTSNALYCIPGLIGFAYFSGRLPPWNSIMAACFWAAGMHLFSAIPDIISDRSAGLTTTAVYYGKRRSLIICSLLWGASFLCASENLLAITPWSLPLLAYPFIPLYVLMRQANVIQTYWWFPLINTVSGALLFAGIIAQR